MDKTAKPDAEELIKEEKTSDDDIAETITDELDCVIDSAINESGETTVRRLTQKLKDRFGKFYPVLPYIPLPFIMALFIILYYSKTDMFIILLCELVIILGYITAVTDLRTKTIPNRLILIMLAAWVAVMLPKIIVDTDVAMTLLIESAIGFAIAGGLALLVYIISRKGLGGGDVKFLAVAGLYLGYGGILSALLYGSVLAALTGVVLILIKKINKKDTIPLAPFLYIGILITIFYRGG